MTSNQNRFGYMTRSRGTLRPDGDSWCWKVGKNRYMGATPEAAVDAGMAERGASSKTTSPAAVASAQPVMPAAKKTRARTAKRNRKHASATV